MLIGDSKLSFLVSAKPIQHLCKAVNTAPKTGYNTKVGGDRQPVVERSIAFCLAELAGYRNVSVLFSSAVSPLIQHGVRVFKTDLPKMGEVS